MDRETRSFSPHRCAAVAFKTGMPALFCRRACFRIRISFCLTLCSGWLGAFSFFRRQADAPDVFVRLNTADAGLALHGATGCTHPENLELSFHGTALNFNDLSWLQQRNQTAQAGRDFS